MKYLIVSLRDAKTGFGIPQTEVNEQTALRNFEYAFNKKGTLVYEHAADYSLYKVGEYDTETGVLSGCTVPELIVDALSVQNKEENV